MVSASGTLNDDQQQAPIFHLLIEMMWQIVGTRRKDRAIIRRPCRISLSAVSGNDMHIRDPQRRNGVHGHLGHFWDNFEAIDMPFGTNEMPHQRGIPPTPGAKFEDGMPRPKLQH